MIGNRVNPPPAGDWRESLDYTGLCNRLISMLFADNFGSIGIAPACFA